jgi:hypothetical protein
VADVPEPERFAVLLVSLWIERDGRAVAHVSQGFERSRGDVVQVVHSLPELLGAVDRWAAPYLPDAEEPAAARGRPLPS